MLPTTNKMLQFKNRQTYPKVVKYYHIYDKGGAI